MDDSLIKLSVFSKKKKSAPEQHRKERNIFGPRKQMIKQPWYTTSVHLCMIVWIMLHKRSLIIITITIQITELKCTRPWDCGQWDSERISGDWAPPRPWTGLSSSCWPWESRCRRIGPQSRGQWARRRARSDRCSAESLPSSHPPRSHSRSDQSRARWRGQR